MAELKGQPKEVIRNLFQFSQHEKEYVLKGYLRLLEDVLLINDRVDLSQTDLFKEENSQDNPEQIPWESIMFSSLFLSTVLWFF